MKRTGFTLVEMMVVVMIIAILAGLTLSGLQMAQDSAAKMRTKATISKLNRFIMEKYASYQYRNIPGVTGTDARTRSKSRLTKLWLLQKEEMPDRYSDIQRADTTASYRMQQMTNKGARIGNNGAAEFLYLIVMNEPGSDVAFSSAEIGDTDHNGLNEFVDGWGNPIWYIRWPAGHWNGNNGAISQIQTTNSPTVQHDPFDPMRVDAAAYAVFPLIFSAGPDGQRGILMGGNKNVPYTGDAGSPGEGSQGADGNIVDQAQTTPMYYDNITNHNLE